MGHRANYALKENGSVQLYYSQWGGVTVPQDMFWGPEHAQAAIRSLDRVPENQWLNDRWGEGGVAMDLDARQIWLFGGDVLSSKPNLPVFLKLMKALWAREGWTVEWAQGGMPAIASAVGFDPSIATSDPVPPVAAPLERMGRKWMLVSEMRRIHPTFPQLQESVKLRHTTLVTTILEDGADHRVSDFHASGMLANGPTLLDFLDRLPTLGEVVEIWDAPDLDDFEWGLGDELSGSIIVWPHEHRLKFREFGSDMATAGFLAGAWSGWEFQRFTGGVAEHFAQFGEALPDKVKEFSPPTLVEEELSVAEDTCIDEIAAILLDRNLSSPQDTARQLFNLKDDEITDPPGALEPPPHEERVELFSLALAAHYSQSAR